MKTLFRIRTVMLSCLFFSWISMDAGVIYSTTAGGNWNVNTTWEGGQIPGAADDVIIRTGATVNTVLGIYNTCNNLTVQAGAVLINNGSNAILTLNGSLVNEGTIRNGTGNLELIINQNITYNGTEFSNFRIRPAGTANNCISFGAGKAYTGSSFIVNGSPRIIYGMSDLSFSNTSIDFNGATLVMSDECRLTVSGQSLVDVLLTGTRNELELNNNAYIQNSTLAGTSLFGIIRVGGTLIFNDSVTVTLGSTLENYGSSHTVTVDGDLTNYGTITNTSNNLTIATTGDIYNYGVWENYETNLTGTSDQHITFGNGTVYSGTNFYNSNPVGKSVYALSDLEFEGSIVNFAYGAAGGIRGTLVLPDNGCLKFSGGGSDKVLSRINLESMGTTARVWVLSGGYIQSFSNTCDDLILAGSVRAGNNEIYLANDVHIIDTLTNFGMTSHLVFVDGNIFNVGYIIAGAANLEMYVTGNVIYHGMAWSINKVNLTGTTVQTIDFAPSSVFSCTYLEASSAHDIQVTSDLFFNGTIINFDNSDVTFTDGLTLTLEGATARIYNAHMFGDMHLVFSGGAYLSSIDFNGVTELSGSVQIHNNAVIFYGEVENTEQLQNQSVTAHTSYLYSHLYNNGTIENGTGMGNFALELKGNVINNGVWTNYENKLNGAGNQHIRLNEDKPISSKFILYSQLGGSGYQWYKDNVIIPGATTLNLTLNQVTPAEYGLYYCTSSQGQSRIFTINRYMDVDFTGNPTEGCQPLEVVFADGTTSPYPLQNWSWTFGDGHTSGEQNPVHTYEDEDIYDVSLTVDDGYLTRQYAIPSYITADRTPFPGFSFTEVVLGNETDFTDLTTNVIIDATFDTLYADEVIGFSSQWNPGIWSAQKALGEPDVYPLHKDDTSAWASETANGQREYLELRYGEARQINKIIIYETLYPGTLDTVYVRNPSSGLWEPVWTGTAAPQPLVARAFTVIFPLTTYLVTDVRIALNSPAVPYWNEIDAVAIVSPVSSQISSQTAYLWDVGENGITFTTKGDISYTYHTAGFHSVSLTVTNNGQCDSTMTHQALVLDPPVVTWNGSVSSDWNDLANWTPTFVPVAETDVLIPDVTPDFTPVLTGSGECKNLTLQPGSNLTIDPGGSLVVNGETLIMAEP